MGISNQRCRKQSPQFVVNRIHHTDFHDFKALSSFVKNRRNNNGDTVQWLKIKWLRLEKSRPYVIQYKYSITDQAFMELDVSMVRGRPGNVSHLTLAPAYQRRIPISTSKKNDLLSLLAS